ncbi:Solute-binding protein [Dissostichus eleginoides]|uniref:Solute-binding protein n=1 Tax=Dissostichus eleginoides TaxID=100907 RepID=A0AAD9BNQ1_DISEL|nr:Solute-binding protein [Dissostichus eleginoides]
MEEKQLKSRWPALFSERQIQAEFQRIVTTDLLSSFLVAWPQHCWRKMTQMRRRTAALLGLSHYMSGENQANVIRMCDAHGDTLEEAMKGMRVGLLIGYEGERDAFPQQIFNVAVVVEETIVLHNLKDVACGLAKLLGIMYSLNLQYPLEMKYSFEFLQRVVMKIQSDQASAKVHGLQNKLGRR